MTGQQNIIYCDECQHCFKNRRSKTGYSCEVWGHGDFASDTVLSGFCHKAKPKISYLTSTESITINQLLDNLKEKEK